MLLDELLALSCRLSVLLYAVTELEKAFVSCGLGLGACTASDKIEWIKVESGGCVQTTSSKGVSDCVH